MKKILFNLLSIIIVSIYTQVDASQDTVNISGIVFSQINIPTTGVVVEVVQDNKVLCTSKTNANGLFSCPNIATGDLLIKIHSSSGSLNVTAPPKTLLAERGKNYWMDIAALVYLNDVPPRLTHIKGIVNYSDNSSLEEMGTPIHNATVKVISPYDHNLIVEVKTDKDGRYELSISKEGQFIIIVVKPGFIIKTSSILARGGMRNVNFELNKLNLEGK